MAALGVTLDPAAKIPDVIVHHRARNWLLLIEAVTSAGPVDGKLRKDLKDLFAGCKAGLVTAFELREGNLFPSLPPPFPLACRQSLASPCPA